MKKRFLLVASAVAMTGLLASCAASGEPTSDKPIELTFQSLAYQDTTVAATDEIVAEWNKENPKVQVKLVQGSWDNVHDQLVTQFQGGTAPDIIQDESSDILGFANQGYLADLSDYLSDDVKKAVSQDVWDTVTVDGKIIAAPTLLQTYVVYANKTAFAAAGVELPTGDELQWSDLQSTAKAVTNPDSFGIAWGLKQPAAAMMNTSLGFGGTFFDVAADGTATIDVGSNELEVPGFIHEMAYTDGSLDPVSLTQSGSDVLPGFLGGKYAMYVGGNFLAQQITEAATADFDWTVLPALAGSDGNVQAANPQTMSVAAESKNPKEAAEFINFFMGADNQAKLAMGDWLIPASADARAVVEKATAGQAGWKELLATGENLKGAPFQKATDYPQWKDQYATPGFQQYFANAISAEELAKQLTEGWKSVQG